MQQDSLDRLIAAQLVISFVADKSTFKTRMTKLLRELEKKTQKTELVQELIDTLHLEKA